MKMYLNEQQTAKLIELGFEKPKVIGKNGNEELTILDVDYDTEN